MTICSPGFSPSDTSTCASPVGALTTILRLCTLLSSTTQTYMLFPSLSPKTALSGMIVQLSCTSGPTSAVKRMLQVKPGFTAYKSRSNEGSSIVMLTGIPVPSVDMSRYSSSLALNTWPLKVSNSTRKRGSLARRR